MRTFAAVMTVAGLAASAPAQIEVIYTKIAGHPTAVVPGAKDLTGAPAATDFRAMEDLIGSWDGTRWFLKGRTQLGSDLETVVLLGSGTSGTAFFQEGQPAIGGGFYDFVASGVGRFDTAGNFVLGMRVRTGLTGSTSASDGQRCFYHDITSGTTTIAFKQLDPYTGLDDPSGPGNETVGNSVGSFHITDEGVVGCQDSTINGISTTRRPAIFYNRAMFHQTNFTAVAALGGLGNRLWNTIDANSFYTSPDGVHWIATGRVTGDGSNPDVLVYDGSAVLQTGVTVPGSSLVCGTVSQAAITSAGDWIARGRDNSGTTAAAPDFLVRNGVLLAQTGDPIITGSSELLGDTFYSMAADGNGNYAFMANTNIGDTQRDNVIVYNGTHVLAREGDPIDLDGNGIDDDNAYLGRGVATNAAFVANNSMFLSADGHLYFLGMVRDGDGNDRTSSPVFGTPNALLRVPLPGGGNGCDPDYDQNGVADQDDVSYLINVISGGENPTGRDPDFDQNGIADQDDVALLINVVAGGECV